MKSVGEVMAIGRTFKEALGKAWRGIEKTGFDLGGDARPQRGRARWRRSPTGHRGPAARWSRRALAAGHTVDEVAAASAHRPVVRRPDRRDRRGGRRAARPAAVDAERRAICWRAKRLGLSDARLAMLTASTEAAVRRHRDALGVAPVFKTVDTCAGEFPARTPVPLLDLRGGDRGRARRRGPGW